MLSCLLSSMACRYGSLDVKLSSQKASLPVDVHSGSLQNDLLRLGCAESKRRVCAGPGRGHGCHTHKVPSQDAACEWSEDEWARALMPAYPAAALCGEQPAENEQEAPGDLSGVYQVLAILKTLHMHCSIRHELHKRFGR